LIRGKINVKKQKEWEAVANRPRFFRECGTIAHAKAAKDGKEDWLLEIGERIAHVPHAWDFKGGLRRTILDA
jgi:hypothetical protein